MKHYFTRFELGLWIGSAAAICVSFLLFDRANYLTLAALEDITYLSVIICLVMFLVNDLYGYANRKRIEQRQLSAQ